MTELSRTPVYCDINKSFQQQHRILSSLRSNLHRYFLNFAPKSRRCDAEMMTSLLPGRHDCLLIGCLVRRVVSPDTACVVLFHVNLGQNSIFFVLVLEAAELALRHTNKYSECNIIISPNHSLWNVNITGTIPDTKPRFSMQRNITRITRTANKKVC